VVLILLFAFLFFALAFRFCLAPAVPLLLFAGARAFLFFALPTGALHRQSVPRPGRLVLFIWMFAVPHHGLGLQLVLTAVKSFVCQPSVPVGWAPPALACGSWLHVWLLARYLCAVCSDGLHTSSEPLCGFVRAAVW